MGPARELDAAKRQGGLTLARSIVSSASFRRRSRLSMAVSDAPAVP